MLSMAAPAFLSGNASGDFFNNQLSVRNQCVCPRRGDFLVNDRYFFEVGGPGKTFDQIKDVPESYLALDGIEVGRGARVPLWMFGLLY